MGLKKVEKKKFIEYKKRLEDLDLDSPLYNYFHNLIEEVEREYEIAARARSKGIDPEKEPESIFTWDMAERIEGMIKIQGVADAIRNFSTLSREELAFKLVDMLMEGKFGTYRREDLVDVAVRLAVAILTEGMTVAPLDGIRKVIIKRGRYGEYLSIYYAGPIRSAGGTEAGLSIVYADYIRKKLGLSKYVPTEQEVYRYLEELRLYERYVSMFQYKHSDEDFLYAVRRLPVEVTGVPTEDIEVVVYRDLPNIETNRIRGGAIRVINDGLIGKASKILSVTKSLGLSDWNWLEYYHNKKSNSNTDKRVSDDKILRALVMGRPVFSLSNESPSFRIRYGREANSGISAVGIHPSVFALLNYFIVIGSQLKVNLPGKAAIVVPCKKCDPPIVELNDGSVIELTDPHDAELLKDKVKKILWLGDILISYGDFLENNHFLVPSPYVEEWWIQDLKQAVESNINKTTGLLELISKVLNGERPTYKEAKLLSQRLDISMHPYYTPRWSRLSTEEFLRLLHLLENGFLRGDNFLIHKEESSLELLKKLLIPYRIDHGNNLIIISQRYSSLFYDLSKNVRMLNLLKTDDTDVFYLLKSILGVKFKDTEGFKISARLGRPEKVKPRQMSPPVHVLFPIENYGGSQRDIIKAMKEKEEVSLRLGIRYCPKCRTYTYKRFCEICGRHTEQRFYCPNCRTIVSSKVCPRCGAPTQPFKKWTINLKDLVTKISTDYNLLIPKRVKGVKGLLNKEGIAEDLSKGLIRARYGVSIFKDGTSRVDITNAPLHMFRTKDIGLSLEKAKSLGYNPSSEDDLLDLYPNDIIIPTVAADYLLKVSKYIDELLVKVYNLKPFYNFQSRSDLIGTVVIGLSPHTSVGVLGRIIGFTDSQVLYANPLWHAAKRRDCDGDQDSIMLLLDVLINFSRHYLPKSSGGEMDAPVFISIFMHPEEVDTQVHNMDVMETYPREFYIKTQEKIGPKEIRNLFICIEDLLGTSSSFYKFHSFGYPGYLSLHRNVNMYSSIKTMEKKLELQLDLIDKIFDTPVKKKILAHLIDHHIIRDIMGNIKSFATQTFRCKRCNHIHRRLPLDGRCEVCGGELIQTVSIRSITKYLPYAKKLSSLIDDQYLRSVISLLEADIKGTFKEEKHRFTTLLELLNEETEHEENI